MTFINNKYQIFPRSNILVVDTTDVNIRVLVYYLLEFAEDYV